MDYYTQQLVIGIAVIVVLALYFGFKSLLRKWGTFMASARYDVFELGSTRWFVGKKVYRLSLENAIKLDLIIRHNIDWFEDGYMEIRPYAMSVTKVGKPNEDGRVKYALASVCTKQDFHGTMAIMLKPEWLTEK